MARDDLVGESLVGLGAGCWMFYAGFKGLRLKRLIAGIATSKVRSAAMGTVEFAGTAQAAASLLDPLYKKPCVFYRILIDEERGSGKSRRWVTIHTADSSNRPFWLEDDTGRALILPAGAQTYFKTDLRASTGLFGSDPDATRYIRETVGGGGTRRLSAEIVRPGDALYALGYACPMEKPMSPAEELSRRVVLPLQELARRLKSDPARMKALDKNQDGSVDAEEWEEGLRKFKQRLELEAALEDSKPAAQAPKPVSGLCLRLSPEGLLLLADCREKDLLFKIGGAAILQIFAGPALALASAAYLAWKFKLLPGSAPPLLESP